MGTGQLPRGGGGTGSGRGGSGGAGGVPPVGGLAGSGVGLACPIASASLRRSPRRALTHRRARTRRSRSPRRWLLRARPRAAARRGAVGLASAAGLPSTAGLPAGGVAGRPPAGRTGLPPGPVTPSHDPSRRALTPTRVGVRPAGEAGPADRGRPAPGGAGRAGRILGALRRGAIPSQSPAPRSALPAVRTAPPERRPVRTAPAGGSPTDGALPSLGRRTRRGFAIRAPAAGPPARPPAGPATGARRDSRLRPAVGAGDELGR